MEQNTKKAIAILLLGCFVVSLTAISATAKTYTEGMGEKNPNDPNSLDDHRVILKYQKCLKELGYLDDIDVTGYYDSVTTQAVEQFQEDYDVTPVTGNIGGKTHNALKKAIRSNSPTVWYTNKATGYGIYHGTLDTAKEIGSAAGEVVGAATGVKGLIQSFK